MKFVKPFYGCKKGEIYPTRFEVGDECPPELEAAARSVGAISVKAEPKRKAQDKQ